MKKSYLVILLFSLITLNSCNQNKYYYVQGLAQGTTYHITYEGTKDYSSEITDILRRFDMSLSAYIDNSLLSRLNNNDSTAIPDKWFTDVFNKSKEIYQVSDGMFDITVGPLVKAWGFLKDTTVHVDSASIKKMLTIVGMDKVRIVNGKLVKDNPNIVIDVNAIAQGYSVDVVGDFLEKNNVRNYLVEIGGELKVKGVNPKNEPWRVGIDKPVEGNQVEGANLQTILNVTNKAIATSGNYRAFHIENGIKYAHSINPKTGYPTKNNLLSASIIADDCITADGYATACMVSGLQKSMDILKKVKGLDAYFVYSDSAGHYKVFMTDNVKKMISKN